MEYFYKNKTLHSFHSFRCQQLPGPKPQPGPKLHSFNMHALSVIALAIGATAVSAQQACEGFCQFPENGLFCPRSGLNFTKEQIIDVAKTVGESKAPYETDANELATAGCQGALYSKIPLYVVSLLPLFEPLPPNTRVLTLTFADSTSK